MHRGIGQELFRQISRCWGPNNIRFLAICQPFYWGRAVFRGRRTQPARLTNLEIPQKAVEQERTAYANKPGRRAADRNRSLRMCRTEPRSKTLLVAHQVHGCCIPLRELALVCRGFNDIIATTEARRHNVSFGKDRTCQPQIPGSCDPLSKTNIMQNLRGTPAKPGIS